MTKGQRAGGIKNQIEYRTAYRITGGGKKAEATTNNRNQSGHQEKVSFFSIIFSNHVREISQQF